MADVTDSSRAARGPARRRGHRPPGRLLADRLQAHLAGLGRSRRSCRRCFYVLAMGVLLGGFIEGDPAELEGATSYLAFVVPGLVAAHAMQTAVGETTYPVMGMIKWHKRLRLDARHAAAVRRPRRRPPGVRARSGWRRRARCSCWCWRRSGSSRPGGGRSLAFVVAGPGRHGVRDAGLRASRPAQVARRASACCSGSGVFPLFLFSGAFFPVANLGAVGGVARPADAAVARRQPVPDVLPRQRRLVVAAVNVAVPGRARCVVGWSVRRLTKRLVLMADDLELATVERPDPLPAGRRRRPRLLVLRNYLVYRERVEAVPHRLPRAGLLPVLDRHRRRPADRRPSSSTARRSRTPSSWRPACSPRRRSTARCSTRPSTSSSS